MLRRLVLPILFILVAATPVLFAGADITETKAAVSPYARLVLAARPVGYWRLDEVAGAGSARDVSGHHHDAAYHGKPRLGIAGALLHDADAALGLAGSKTRSYAEVAPSKEFSVATSGRGLSVEL